MPPWNWIALGALATLSAWQQYRIFRIRRQSAKREELFQIVTENAADMIALVDVKGHRLYNSPAYKRILGYSAAELGETTSFEQIHPDDRFKVLEAAQQARSTGVGQRLEYRIRHKNGSWRVLESVAGTIRDEKGDVTKLVIINRDITDRKRAEEQAEHNSFHDGLTDLPNRHLFLERLQNLFDRAQRNPKRQYALLFVDLDGFKVFNDTMGHVVGDQIIVEMGRRLGACLREEDLVSRAHDNLAAGSAVLSRFGGDEFTILLEAVTDPSDAMRVGRRVLAAISALLLVEGREIHTSASVGIALSTPALTRADEILQEADVAMRRAKALGGSRCEVFDEAMHTRAHNRLKLESDLREAMEKKQFRLHYQPIVNLETGRIEAFEALLRWQHPQEGLISPDRFMAAAEDRGLLISIGQWVFEQACRQVCDWNHNSHGTENLSVRVNISLRQLADPGFLRSIESVLASTAIDPARLRLEIAEKVAADDLGLLSTVVAGLRHLGVEVDLDDFGSANLSLIALRHIPLLGVKIGRTLIGEMMADHSACEAIEWMILLAHKMNLKVTAEGIETVKQRDRLREAGCDTGQGYLFSPPVEAEAAAKLLRQQRVTLRLNGPSA
jgi:diguanylate cyclase (GGDEF)-like protein/PAS domain S-box-containing protein